VRYAGQAFDLGVDAPDTIDPDALETVAERFHERHETRYGHASPGEPLELTAIRLRARGRVDPPDLRAEGGDHLDDAREGTRAVGFGSTVGGADEYEAAVYDGDRLPIGATIEGPAVVEGGESTVIVPPGSTGERDGRGTLHLEVST
jgi:N-methylhydantoinase A